ncbi:aldehyde oxidase GLOX1-like [Arachis stenosperma]|uniref:aldehyde oxidase GLOX1-like n=1 Tax=Arachis stenosperma TaxID=217475 RepID=UPI0025AD1CDC|nr:aldehyde oxidase GLOX1-like [Arachis stenosperma]
MENYLYKVLLILTLFLFFLVAVDSNILNKHHKHHRKSRFKPIYPDPRFPVPFPINDPTNPINDHNDNNNPTSDGGDTTIDEEITRGDFETDFNGEWELLSPNSGVSAMQINLMPTNKIIVYDATIYRISRIQYPPGVPCVPFMDEFTHQMKQDCFAHSMEYDLDTNQARPLKVTADPWCSCGGLAPDGTLISSGGFRDGSRTIRYYGGPNCQKDCDWREHNEALKEDRWYGSQTILPNGDFIVIGGRRSFSYEFLPKVEGQITDKPYFFPFLYETSDLDENNLYPFVHLIPDGNLFLFSNNRSLLLNPTNNKVVRTFPVLPGGSRNYPASGMSALLPINLNNNNNVTAEVIVCGGNNPNAFFLAETRKTFLSALQDCNRMVITDPNPTWDSERMPSRRTMGDALILPNGQILFINGAQVGTSAWWDADQPNLTPVLYTPQKAKGKRFKVMKPTTIARMYHSTSAVIPNGKIWVAGSNTHDTYKDHDKFPTETRVEGFSPPYLDPKLDNFRPQIIEQTSTKDLKYGVNFETQFSVKRGFHLTKNDIKVTMYFPPFTTHGVSMSQRLLVLKNEGFVQDFIKGVFKLTSVAPPAGEVAPPGYYLLFVVHRGVPSKGMWVHIQK